MFPSYFRIILLLFKCTFSKRCQAATFLCQPFFCKNCNSFFVYTFLVTSESMFTFIKIHINMSSNNLNACVIHETKNENLHVSVNTFM